MELIKEDAKSINELSEAIGFATRQGDYYYNAARYLGLAKKCKDADGIVRVRLSELGISVMKLPYKERQLKYIKLMFEHEIFRVTFFASTVSAKIVDKNFICEKMIELNLCGPSLVGRRASTVMGWLKWIFSIINE